MVRDVSNGLLFFGFKKGKKGRKRRVVHAFFRRACEAVKQLFPCCDPDRVQPPKAEPDLDQSQLVLPEQDQVSADLQSSPEEEGPSEIQAHDAVLSDPVSGSVPGPVSGSVSGSVPGAESGSVSGSVPGPVSGSVPGSVSGPVSGSVPGSVSGPVSGSVPGSVSGPVSLIVSETAFVDGEAYRSTEAVCVSQDQMHTPRLRSSASPYSTPQQQTSGRWQFCSLRSFTDICPSKALMPFSTATSGWILPYPQVNTQTAPHYAVLMMFTVHQARAEGGAVGA